MRPSTNWPRHWIRSPVEIWHFERITVPMNTCASPSNNLGAVASLLPRLLSLTSAGAPEPAGTNIVCRPLLPNADHLVADLKSIDKRRWYSNWGELNRSLEAGLCAHFGFPERGCVTASNGTDAITAALIAVAGRGTAARPYCLMPSYTFVATAVAALNAGYTPYFVDINPDTLALDPGSVNFSPRIEADRGRPGGRALRKAGRRPEAGGDF